MSLTAITPVASTWTRRSFLGTLSALAIGSLTGCGLGGGDLREDLTGGPGAPGRASSASWAGYTPTAPYTLSAASELSQDYFLVQTHRIDPAKDTVIAYSRADGEVEAMLLQDGAIRQLYRDSGEVGGWGVYELPSATNGVLDMVAGMSHPQYQGQPVGPPTLKVFFRTSANPDALNIAVRDQGDAPSFTTTTVPWNRNAGPLQLTVNADWSLLAAAMVESSTSTATDAKMFFCYDGDGGPNHGFATGFLYQVDPQLAQILPKGVQVGWSAIIAQPNVLATGPAMLMYLPYLGYFDTKFPSVRVWYAPIQADQGATATVQPWPYYPGATVPPMLPNGGAVVSVEYLTVLGGRYEPTAVVRTLSGDGKRMGLAVLTRTDKTNTWTWNMLQLPDAAVSKAFTVSTALRPSPASEDKPGMVASFLDIFLVADDTMSVIRQAPQNDGVLDGIQPAYTPPIPLQPEVAVMTSQAGQSTGNELILVGTDGALHALTKDPTTGQWADIPVHLPAAELEEVATYRVTLTVQDSWQNAVVGKPLQVTAATPVTALVDGAGVVLGAAPLTTVTDARGEAVVSIIADGLSAPTLTVAGTDLPTLTVNPSGPINTYLQGKTALNNLSPLTGGGLAAAKTPDGAVVAPGASDSKAADDAVQNMALAATQAATSSLNARRSTVSQRRDGQLGANPTRAELQDIVHDLDNWGHDALHAVKKGALKLKDVSYDAEQKTFHLISDLEQWAKNEILIVVHDIEDAAHVIHGFLNKLGGWIKDAVKWLEAAVLGTLRDSVAVAHQYEQWIGSCCDFLSKEILASEAAVLTWLTNEQADVTKKFTDLANRFAPGTTLSNMASQPPQGVGSSRGRPPATGRLSNSGSDDQNSPHGNWFLQKVGHELRGGLELPELANFEAMVKACLEAAAPALKDMEAAFVDFMGFLKTVVTSPKKVRTVGVKDLLLAVAKLIDAIFDLAKAVVSAAFPLFAAVVRAIPQVLATPLSATPVVGKLLGLVKFVGDIKIGTIVNLLFAFPTVVAYKIVHGVESRPFANLSATRGPTAGLGDIASDLQFSAGAALFTWANFDTVSAAYTAAKQEPPMLFAAIDIAAPIVATFLTVPSTQGGQPYFAPPVSGKAADILNFASWVLGAAPALTAGAVLFIDKKVVASAGSQQMKDLCVWWECGAAVLSTVTGMVGNGEDDSPSGPDYAIAVLNNLGAMASPGLIDKIAESTEGVSVVVTMALTEVCGLIGAVLYGFDG